MMSKTFRATLIVVMGAALLVAFFGRGLFGDGRGPSSQVLAAERTETVVACSGTNRAPAPPPGVPTGNQVGQLAYEITLPDLSGRVVSLSSFRGCVVILEFWASWCAPCRATLPLVHNLAEKYKARGVKFLGVALDARMEDAQRFLNQLGLELPTLWGSFWEARQVAERYGVLGIPRTFLIDRQGIIRFVGHPIYLTEEVLAPWL